MRLSSLILVLAIGSFSQLATAAAQSNITFVNQMVKGKKTWVPATSPIEFKKDSLVQITLKNNLEGPHGFFIKGMTDPILVPGKLKGGVTPEMSFSMKTAGKTGKYDFKCHMHPAHVGGSFSIVE